jgi:superfamily II DNA or RNA helicase
MKESALKETESKKVVIATYAMAAEALDIKTLTTLIMATPKTDIEQSVGRILREKHSSPVVVDIVDSHQLFRNQWTKRKTFYKRENYKITFITSANYNINRDYANWKIVYNPKSDGPKECKPKKSKNVLSKKSNSSTDKSISESSDEEDEPEAACNKDKYISEVCYLKIK